MEKVKEVLSFYTPYANIDRMIQSLKIVLQDEIVRFEHYDMCINLELRNNEFLHIPYVTIDFDTATFKTQIQRLYASTSKRRCENLYIQQNLLYQIALFRGAFVFEFNYDENNRDEKILPLMEIADKMNALIFWETGDVSDSYGDVIISQKGTSEMSVFNPIDGFDIKNKVLGLSEVQLKRIQNSMMVLRYNGVYAPYNIAPPFDEQMYLFQDGEDILKRCIASMLLGMYSNSLLSHNNNAMLAYESIEKIIRLYRASPYFTIKEIEYLNNTSPNHADIYGYKGYFECSYILLWVLGFMDNLYFPNAVCDESLVIHTILNYDTIDKLRGRIKLRSKAELLDALDITQRYAWACKDARRLQFEMPSGLSFEAVAYRHKTLAWVVSERDILWDEIHPSIKSLRLDKKLSVDL